MRSIIRKLILPLLFVVAACSEREGNSPAQASAQDEQTKYFPSCTHGISGGQLAAQLRYKVIARYPHDPQAFSQGLVYQNGVLYESTGLYGRSSVRATRLVDQQLLKKTDLGDSYFGEGLTLLDNELIQLTWKSGAVFRYSLPDLSLTSEHSIAGEGWGLTQNGTELINSDGSANLYFRDVATLDMGRQLEVKYAGRPLSKLNELEWVNGCLFANIWLTNTIAVINPDSGDTVYTIDISPLAKPETARNRDHIANGIAYRHDNGNLLVTGKNWQWIYEISLLPEK